jgi:putative SOS response-associated peptidase YedK
MCGRYLSPDQAALERDGDLRVRNPFERVYNAAPTMQLPVLRPLQDGDGREAIAMHWGLVPTWWSKPELPTHSINARSEEAASKPMWRDAVRRGRALVPALGWYEWQVSATGKQPFFLHAPDHGLLWFAGLWAANAALEPPTFAILTREAVASVAPVHHRMPLVLGPVAAAAWLAPGTDRGSERLAAAVAAVEQEFACYPVSTWVNSPRNQGERCIAPLPAA